jgi:hypothetical protein
MAAGVEGELSAREWIEDAIRMTHGDRNGIDGRYLTVAIDGHDDIHTYYGYRNFQNEDYARQQPVYQKFNHFGEALTEPLVLGVEIGLPDTLESVTPWDMFMDSDDNLYLLWSDNREMNYTKLNRNGEVLVDWIELTGVRYSVCSSGRNPQIAVDSDGNIIVMAVTELEDSAPLLCLRYNPEGELMDTIHVLQPQYAIFRDPVLEIDSEDNIYAVWQTNNDDYIVHYRVHYSKIDMNDNVLVDDYSLPHINCETGLTLTSFALSRNWHPIFHVFDSFEDRTDSYLIMLDNDLEEEFRTNIGNAFAGYSDGFLFIDDSGNIHITDAFYMPDLHEYRFLGYTELNENGEIIDSVQVIHDRNMREGRRPAGWKSEHVLKFSDGLIGIIWLDDRHAESASLGKELYIRHTIPENIIESNNDGQLLSFSLYPNYPNPFNNSTCITFTLPFNGFTAISITDLSGRNVATLLNERIPAGVHHVNWNASNYPAGVYFVKMTCNKESMLKKIVLIR